MKPQALKLGKKLAKAEDPRTFQLRRFFDQWPEPPKSSFVGRGEPVRMYGNNRWGNCTCAAKAHGIDLHERSSRQRELQITDQDVLTAYRRIMVGDDGGAYMLDSLKDWYRFGLGREADGTPHTIGAFAEIQLRTANAWKVASWMFGGIYAGAWLPISAADQLESGRWTLVDDSTGDPGSWGGHAMWADGYTATGPQFTTWDQRVKATWEWAAKYVDEAYVVISEDFLSKKGTTRQGFNVDALNAALAAL